MIGTAVLWGDLSVAICRCRARVFLVYPGPLLTVRVRQCGTACTGRERGRGGDGLTTNVLIKTVHLFFSARRALRLRLPHLPILHLLLFYLVFGVGSASRSGCGGEDVVVRRAHPERGGSGRGLVRRAEEPKSKTKTKTNPTNTRPVRR